MLMLVTALFLAACNSDNSTTDKDKEKDKGGSTKTSETAKIML